MTMLTLKKVLKPEEVKQILDHLAKGTFQDGRLTAGGQAKRVKKNLQLKRGDKTTTDMEALVARALLKHPVFRRAAMPRRILPPMFSRYDKKMQYGVHVDNPVMDKGQGPTRTDLSLTLFLSDPKSYEGGELVVESVDGRRKVKLAAGDAILYPSNSFHQVMPVKKGERLAAVTWVQSMIRDPWQREVLFDLGVVQAWAAKNHPKVREAQFLSKIYGDLVRMWGDI